MGSQFRSFSLNTFSCTRPVIMADTIWEGKVRLHRYIWEDQQSSLQFSVACQHVKLVWQLFCCIGSENCKDALWHETREL